MNKALHITSGDCAGAILSQSGIPGEIFVWHDILYDGPRLPGRPEAALLDARARFLEQATGGGLTQELVRATLRAQYEKLETAEDFDQIVLWFDACLFDQSMLIHILTCLPDQARPKVELLCVDSFPGIVPYHGLGQLQPAHLVSLYDRRRPVTPAQFRYAALVDEALASRNIPGLVELAGQTEAPLPWVPPALTRWLLEQPDSHTGLGRLDNLILNALRAGCETPFQVYAAVSQADTSPQYWGDTTLWARINSLADRTPPRVRITGPAPRLPQWQSPLDLATFRLFLD